MKRKETLIIHFYYLSIYHEEFSWQLQYLLNIHVATGSNSLSIFLWQCSTLIDNFLVTCNTKCCNFRFSEVRHIHNYNIYIILFHMVSALAVWSVKWQSLEQCLGQSAHHQQLWIAVSQLVSTVYRATTSWRYLV